jgi:hypothetical protein
VRGPGSMSPVPTRRPWRRPVGQPWRIKRVYGVQASHTYACSLQRRIGKARINHDTGANPAQVVRAPDDIVVCWEDIVEPRLLPRTAHLTSLRYSPKCVP